MKSLLDNVNELDVIIRQLEKMESRMRSGQWIDAWRECNRLLAAINRAKQDLIKKEQEQNAQ
jgi:cell fate (sporulation/competence/biofilm development) regulator YlbF (YheA/YmcA/DUF963 family)